VGVPRFVGRDDELQRAADALGRFPAVVLVQGEAGIGKSRLVREALAVAGAGGSRWLIAVCPPFREGLTLGPIVDAARQAVPRGVDLGRLGLSALAGALRPLFPEWADWLPAAPEPLADAGAARHRLMRAFAELLDRLAIRVLVVEDIHWADEATVEFLLFLTSLQPPPCSLVVTYRPDEVAADSPLLRLSSRVPTGMGISHARIVLSGLAASDTAELVGSMLAEPVSAAFTSFLHESTGGVRWCSRSAYGCCLTALTWSGATASGCSGRWRRSWCRRRSGTRSPSGRPGWAPTPSGCCWRPRSWPSPPTSERWGWSVSCPEAGGRIPRRPRPSPVACWSRIDRTRVGWPSGTRWPLGRSTTTRRRPNGGRPTGGPRCCSRPSGPGRSGGSRTTSARPTRSVAGASTRSRRPTSRWHPAITAGRSPCCTS
jgi:hypothetical protein